jgi:hypothetical protein
MSVARVVDGETYADSTYMNTLVDAINVAGSGTVNVAGEDSIEAALAASVSGSAAIKQLYFPAGTYDLDDIMEVSYRSGTLIRGDGPGLTVIRQTAENTPLLRFVTDPFANHITVCDLTLEYENQQSSTDTDAIAIELWGDANAQPNHIRFDNVDISKAHYGIKATNTTDSTAPFMVDLEQLWFKQMAGPAIHIDSASGKPGWKIDGVYISAATGADAPAAEVSAIFGVGLDLIAENIIIDAWPNMRHMSFSGHTLPVILRNIQMGESGTYTVEENASMIYVANGGVDAINIAFGGTINKPTGNTYMFSLDGNVGATSFLRNLYSGGTITSGTVYPVDAFNTFFHAENCLGASWTDTPFNPARSDSVAALLSFNGRGLLQTKAGVPTDADVDIPRDGMQVVDTSNDRLYVRSGGTWMYVALT